MALDDKLRGPGRWSNSFTLGALGRQYTRLTKEFERMLDAERKRQVETEDGAITHISLDLISRLTNQFPYHPTDLKFAVLNPPPQSYLLELLGVTDNPNSSPLLVLYQEVPVSTIFRRDNRGYRLHLQSQDQYIGFEVVGGEGGKYSFNHYIPDIGDQDRVRARMKNAGLIQEGELFYGSRRKVAGYQKLLLFIIGHLCDIHGHPIEQQISGLQSLRPDVDYNLLQREAHAERQSPFEGTPDEYGAWLAPEDWENVSKLMAVLKTYAQEKESSFGLIASGSVIDPMRRWSLEHIPEIDLLMLWAENGKHNYNPTEMAASLQEKLGWESKYSVKMSWDDYGPSHPYLRLQPEKGKFIEIHLEGNPLKTPEDIANIINTHFRGASRDSYAPHRLHFSVLNKT